MALEHSKYLAPDKIPGELFLSDEHNELKTVVNQKPDIDKTIVIEGDQAIDGVLTVKNLIITEDNTSGRLIVDTPKDHITFLSNGVATIIGADSAANKDFYITDSQGELILEANSISGELALRKISIDSSGGSQAILIDSKTNTTHGADILFKRANSISNKISSTKTSDLHFTTQGTDGLSKSRIILGSGKFGGNANSVSLYNGDDNRLVLYTTKDGITVPAVNKDGVILTNTGVQLLNTVGWYLGSGTPLFSSSAIKFTEDALDKYGFLISNLGADPSSPRHTLGFYRNYDGRKEIIMEMYGASSAVTFYGDLYVHMPTRETSVKTMALFTSLKANGNGGTGMLSLPGSMVLGAGRNMGSVLDAEAYKDSRTIIASETDVIIYTNLYYGYGTKKEFKFHNTGDFTAAGKMYATDFLFSSDITLKKEIEPLPDINLDIEFKKFKFKDSDKLRYGVVAQDVQKIMPELVTENFKGDLSVSMIDLLILKVAELERKLNKLN